MLQICKKNPAAIIFRCAGLYQAEKITAGRALLSALTILLCFGHGLKGMTCMADKEAEDARAQRVAEEAEARAK